MFNRVMKCLIIAKKPLSFKPKIQILTLRNSQSINSDLLLLKKCFSSGASKPPEVNAKENETRTETQTENAENLENENVLEALIKSDPTMDKRYKILQLEIEVMRSAGKLVPDDLKPLQWVELLKEETRTARIKYLNFLFKSEKKRENAKLKKEVARIEREKLKENTEFDKTSYGLNKTTMFLRIYDTRINQFYNSRLFQSMMFGQKLVVDCGYYTKMTSRENTYCAKQLAYMFAQNRTHKNPFDLNFCNVHKSSLLMQKFHSMVPPAYDLNFPLNIHEASYTEIFDKDKLVYLTPHCNNEMKEYDPDSIYIIGAIVDKTNSEPLSLAKAKKEGLKMAKLPLDKYLLWGSGSGKRLPLNLMVNILNDLRLTGDWQQALKHVPIRKLERGVEEYNKHKQDYVQPRRPLVDIPFQRKNDEERRSFTFKARNNRSRFSNE